MNKQKGEKKTIAYFTGLINMLLEANANGFPINYDPRELTTITVKMPHCGPSHGGLTRFSSAVNPVAVWEIKEYLLHHHVRQSGSRRRI